MSERGVFAVDRGWFEHPMFAAEPFTEREAWAWLIAEAAWKDRARRIEKYVVELKRGQLGASIRHLARIWQWKRGKVERFLNRLKTETMIGTDARHGITIITVCNYNRYQRVSLPDQTQTETPNETLPRQYRDNTEDIKNIKTTVAAPDEKPMSNLPDWFTPSDLVLDAMGIDQDFRGGWASQRSRLQVWLAKWDLELDILPTVSRLSANRARAGRDPPRTLSFFEAAIADAHITRTAPLPVGKQETRNGRTTENRSLSSFARAAADAAHDFARGDGLCDEGGGDPVRIIPIGKSA